MTAAHRTYPLGTNLTVINLNTFKLVKLRVNDRGPYIKDRILDVSEAAATRLGFKNNGLANVIIIKE